jgi:uncharacterized protein (DUF1800 family)
MAGPLPDSLTQVNPAEAWQPWEPTKNDPWNLKKAAHLYRRAAFGAAVPQLREAVRAGFASTLSRLLRGQSDADDRDQLLDKAGAEIAREGNPDALRGWWVYLLLNSLHPLREKLTLFWHGHFATSIAKVELADLMFGQNRLLRRFALGKFRPFLLEISRDPAMLIWLDSNSNVRGAANENYARELMELFSLGVGHYTETDIREAARAFTGWRTDGGTFEFVPALHDDGVKTVLGKAGRWNGEDIVRIVLDQPAAAIFLVRKLYRFLVSESEDPLAALLEPLAQAFRKSDYDIGMLVKSILSSRLFFSEHAYRRRIKTPVEYVLGLVRTQEKEPVSPAALVPEMTAMGQELLAPPNVKGWAGGKAWLNTATILARNSFAQRMVLHDTNLSKVPIFDVATVLQREKLTDPDRAVDLLVDMYLQGDISKAARAKLISFLADGKPKGEAFYKRAREVVTAIWTMPEYQLA